MYGARKRIINLLSNKIESDYLVSIYITNKQDGWISHQDILEAR